MTTMADSLASALDSLTLSSKHVDSIDDLLDQAKPRKRLRKSPDEIKSQLEQQNRVMSDQTDQIALLLREVSMLKTKVASSEPSDREKDERIRQLELELEEARS